MQAFHEGVVHDIDSATHRMLLATLGDPPADRPWMLLEFTDFLYCWILDASEASVCGEHPAQLHDILEDMWMFTRWVVDSLRDWKPAHVAAVEHNMERLRKSLWCDDFDHTRSNAHRLYGQLARLIAMCRVQEQRREALRPVAPEPTSSSASAYSLLPS